MSSQETKPKYVADPMGSDEMKRLSPGDIFRAWILKGGIKDVIKIDMLGPLKSSCCGIDGPKPDVEATNLDVYKPDGTTAKLLSFASPGRPLVICMGAMCTWPATRNGAREMSLLAAEFRGKADFLLVGCKENHTSDGSSFGKNNGFPGADGENNGRWDLPQPSTLQERIDMVAAWYKDYSDYLASEGAPRLEIPWVVDGMDNQVEEVYRPFPFRNYVVKDGVVIFQGGHGPLAQITEDVKAALEEDAADSSSSSSSSGA